MQSQNKSHKHFLGQLAIRTFAEAKSIRIYFFGGSRADQELSSVRKAFLRGDEVVEKDEFKVKKEKKQ